MPPDQNQLQPGTSISHFRIRKRIGEGGMGVVYEAEDIRLRRRVALKFLSPHLLSSERGKVRITHEARAAASLEHPNICTVHEIDEVEGQIFIAMAFVDGRSLADLLESGPLDPEMSRKTAVQIAAALCEAHRRGIVHRDIKPANIMITEEGKVKILDFGLARSSECSRITKEGVAVGTVDYMSPEQARGDEVDHRTDLWSLGVVLYEMVTGKRPFRGFGDQAVIHSILSEDPRRMALPGDTVGAAEMLAPIIHHCLEKDPEARYQTAGDLLADLEEVGGEPPAEPPCRPPRVARTAPSVTEEVPARLRKIVVLPFENLGPREESYFAEGMTEEITSRLAAVSELGVISRTSAMQYARRGKTVSQIGEDLGVDYVLEGTVRWNRKSGDRVRITPQLIRVSDDTHLWADVFDRVIEDSFDVQSAIASQVIRQVEVTLLEPERAVLEAEPTNNGDAYQAYLRGLSYITNLTVSCKELHLAARMFERAAELDPGFGRAHAGLSRAHTSLFFFGCDQTPERLAKAKEASDRALEVAPDLTETHRARGYYYYWGHRNYERALECFGTAAQGRPNDSQLMADVAFIRRRKGEWPEFLRQIRRAVELDPHNPEILHPLGRAYMQMREYEKAEWTFDRSISMAPDRMSSYLGKVENCWLWDGETARAREVIEAMPMQADPEAVLYWYFQSRFERDWIGALNRLSVAPVDSFINQSWYYPKALLESWCYLRMDEEEGGRARTKAESAITTLEQAAAECPTDPRIPSALARAFATLGLKDEALREGERAAGMVPIAADSITGTRLATELAKTYAEAGELQKCLDLVEELLSLPSYLSVGILRLDPDWDPLRRERRFGELLRSRD